MSQKEKVVETLSSIPLIDEVILPGEFKTLLVGRDASLAGLHDALDNDLDMVMVAQRSTSCDHPQFADVYTVGVRGRIVQVLTLSDKTMKVLVEGCERVVLSDWQALDSYRASFEALHAIPLESQEAEALAHALHKRFADLIKLTDKPHDGILKTLNMLQDPGDIADACAVHLDISLEHKQKVLETLDVKERAILVMGYMEEQFHLIQWEADLHRQVQRSMKEDQESYYKEKRLSAMRKELRDQGSDESDEFDKIEAKIEALKVSRQVRDQFQNELKKLRMMPPMSAEATVVRNYLDWVVNDIPWGKTKRTNKDLLKAGRILENGHYGLSDIKDRILEQLAVQVHVNKVRGPILCLVGPPGVGKTSLGKSIAKAMGRVYVRIALGGVRDEAEIRGHRKTYVGAMPGRVIRALKQAKVENALILLDEIDKLGMDFRGDPASALLEVLDPEQNNTFHDHYIDVPVDLSKVVFITTANSLSDIPPALLDRMEVIELSGYTEAEKSAIVQQHLIPKCLKECGLKEGDVVFSEEAILSLIQHYSREAGVRELERLLHKIARKIVRGRVEKAKGSDGVITVKPSDLVGYLGPEEYDFESIHQKPAVGIVRGLAWTRVGGDMLTIEVVATPGKGKMQFTGSLGDVMQESIETAYTLIRVKMAALGIDMKVLDEQDIHLHIPEGATPKDGPSAGIGMSVALASLVSGIAVRHDVAMTGEITLRGDILPVGGIKEKLLAAHRGKMKTVLIPKENEKDLHKISDTVLKSLDVRVVANIDEVLSQALVKPWVAKKKKAKDSKQKG